MNASTQHDARELEPLELDAVVGGLVRSGSAHLGLPRRLLSDVRVQPGIQRCKHRLGIVRVRQFD
jgi:hypothetical protein